MSDLVVWGLVLLGVLLLGRWVLAWLRRFLAPVVVLLLVLVLTQCEGEVQQLFGGIGST